MSNLVPIIVKRLMGMGQGSTSLCYILTRGKELHLSTLKSLLKGAAAYLSGRRRRKCAKLTASAKLTLLAERGLCPAGREVASEAHTLICFIFLHNSGCDGSDKYQIWLSRIEKRNFCVCLFRSWLRWRVYPCPWKCQRKRI